MRKFHSDFGEADLHHEYGRNHSLLLRYSWCFCII